MTTPDDSALFHAGTYDPAKARAYYLRTRKLKGRQSGGVDTPRGRPAAAAVSTTKRPSGKARREEIKAQQEALEKRLERLKEVLAELVEKAQGRSGVKDETEKQRDTANKNESKKGEKLSAKEKREAAKRSEEYRKENPVAPAKELAALKTEIKDVQKQIQTALADARKKLANPKPNKTAPKGR